ncbi:GIY-YIG nuclease family protein [Streptomyces chartreusis]|uniref:GIY-YIG nuclease family protein n=1 Tax=Streptomyces chartreusis TaxID=1969 RepID=UPI00380F2176
MIDPSRSEASPPIGSRADVSSNPGDSANESVNAPDQAEVWQPRTRGNSVEGSAAYAANLQHIKLLQDKQKSLAVAQEKAEDQILHHYGSGYRCGDISITELLEFFDAYRDLETPRWSRRWNEHVPLPYQTCSLLHPPNGPHHTWIGNWPCPEDAPTPLKGVAVVYILFNEGNEPCYVGSTQRFRTRMNDHVKQGKVFVQWQAFPCPDRESAYELEDRLLKERLPHLNRKAGR